MSTAYENTAVATGYDPEVIVDTSEDPIIGDTTWPTPNAFREDGVVTTYGLSLHQERTIEMCSHSIGGVDPTNIGEFVFEFDGDAMRSHMSNAEDFILKRCVITRIDGDVPHACTVRAYTTTDGGTKSVPLNEKGRSHFGKEWHDAVLGFVPGQSAVSVPIITGTDNVDKESFSQYINIDMEQFTTHWQKFYRKPGSVKGKEEDSYSLPISINISQTTAYANPIAWIAERSMHIKNRGAAETDRLIFKDQTGMQIIVDKGAYFEFIDGINQQINNVRRTVPKGEKLRIVCKPETDFVLPSSMGMQPIGIHNPIMQIQLVIVPYNLTHIQRQEDMSM